MKNQQTTGPLYVVESPVYREPFIIGPTGKQSLTGNIGGSSLSQRQANARLLAASYTLLDRTGRELGIDAATLAESIDLAGLIQFVRQAASYPNKRGQEAAGLIFKLPAPLNEPDNS